MDANPVQEQSSRRRGVGVFAIERAARIPVFAARSTRERLRALAQADGLIQKDQPEVLFVCVQDAGRSQMAAALMHKLSGGIVSVRSAGSSPSDEVNAEACPVFPGAKRRLHWSFPDPSKATGTEADQLAAYRSVRDAIRGRIEDALLSSAQR